MRFLVLVGVALVAPSLPAAPIPPEPVVVPLVVDVVRRPVDTWSQVLVYNGAQRGETIEVRDVRVIADGSVVAHARVDRSLPADPRYAELAATLERLPEEITERHRPRAFVPHDAPVFEGDEVLDRWRGAALLLDDLRRDYRTPGREPFVQVDLKVPMGRVFAAGSGAAEAGARAELLFEVVWRGSDGVERTTTARAEVRRLADRPAAPPELVAEAGGALTIHAGDLHVHSCHGEALGACPPSDNCAAESLQLFGSFTLDQLRSQYEALAVDWFTATDHSYCINDDAEFAAIAAEAAAASDASFLVLPDTELSSDEVGPQQGGDLGDLICFGLTEQNHMGAHDITSRKPGGDDDLLGFCDGFFSDALRRFTDNVASIRADGGYPVVHHPAADSWGWNSFEQLTGIEAGGVHGVEIWNGAARSGQEGNVGQWVDWLLADRLLYAYSGSDTHDAAFDFGANHVPLGGSFDAESLTTAIRAGRVYVSNGPLLVLSARVGPVRWWMGEIVALPADPPPTATVEVRSFYDVGPDGGVITVFRGRVGDGAEQAVCESGPLAGSGVFSCEVTIETDRSSHLRAYVENAGRSRVAYTNPVFFRR